MLTGAEVVAWKTDMVEGEEENGGGYDCGYDRLMYLNKSSYE